AADYADDDPLTRSTPAAKGTDAPARPGRPTAGSSPSSEELLRRIAPLAREVMEAVPEIRGVCINFNPHAGNRILGEISVCVAGEDHIIETVAAEGADLPEQLRQGLKFRLSSHSFFQVNSRQIAPLLEEVRASVSGFHELAVDAYAGVGTIALWLAPVCPRVIAVEEHAGAVADGIANCRLNGIENVEFRLATVEEALPALMAAGDTPSVLVLDPPRKGVS